MIKNNQPLSMAECLEYVKGKEDTEIVGFIKKFSELTIKDAKEIRGKIGELSLIKIRENHISKIIDVLPENAGDLNKIFEDISLDENETNKILEIIKKYK
jgi:DNA-directed RNA polymerase subunit F